MSNAVITVENLGKRYTIAHERERYTALRDVLANRAKHLGRRALRPFFNPESRIQNPESSKEDFWALKDVSFEIHQGDRVGIIGRNGAGKSTLLKLLARITEPTTGKITLKGRVASLLEVGTGFHPELTGRENISLNGAILGMSKQEIKRKFDEIVDFAEIEKFLDTPVKRYSSGMYVRLAFAVAAHLEPEILLVDEVLAVGDAQFQKKCLGKMEDVSAREGRTVLFVSHNMGSIEALCHKGLLLERGQIVRTGPVDLVVQAYLSAYDSDAIELSTHPGRMSGLNPHIVQLKIYGGDTSSEDVIRCGDACDIMIETMRPFSKNASFAIGIYDVTGIPISHLNTDMTEFLRSSDVGTRRVKCRISQLNLTPGRYYVNVAYYESGTVLDHVSQVKRFEVIDSNFLGTGKMPPRSYGKVVLKHEWTEQEQ